jgi:hypothetical protein
MSGKAATRAQSVNWKRDCCRKGGRGLNVTGGSVDEAARDFAPEVARRFRCSGVAP